MKYEQDRLSFTNKLRYTWVMWNEELLIALPFIIISVIIWNKL